MGRIGARIIAENNVLLTFAALDNLAGASLQFAANLANQGHNEGSNDGKDEFGELLLQLLYNLGQNGDLANGGVNTLHDVVMKLDNGHDLSKNVLNIDGEFFGVTRRDGCVFNLSGISVGLNLINPLSLVLIAEDAVGNLVE